MDVSASRAISAVAELLAVDVRLMITVLIAVYVIVGSDVLFAVYKSV